MKKKIFVYCGNRSFIKLQNDLENIIINITNNLRTTILIP